MVLVVEVAEELVQRRAFKHLVSELLVVALEQPNTQLVRLRVEQIQVAAEAVDALDRLPPQAVQVTQQLLIGVNYGTTLCIS
jgi:hypothetical protein